MNVKKLIAALLLIMFGAVTGGVVVNDKNTPYRRFYLSLTLCLDSEVKETLEKSEQREIVIKCLKEAYNIYHM